MQAAESGLEFFDSPVDVVHVVMLGVVFSPRAFLVNRPLHLFGLLAQFVCQVAHVGLFEMLDGGAKMFELLCRRFNVIAMMRVVVVAVFMMICVVVFVFMRAIIIAVLFLQLVGDVSDTPANELQLVTFAGFFQRAGMGSEFFELLP